jgi:hypothetical protein
LHPPAKARRNSGEGALHDAVELGGSHYYFSFS